MHHLIFLFIVLIWSASFIMMKKADLAFGPLSVGALRVLGGALVLAALALLLRRRWRPQGKQWVLLVLLVLIGYAWPYTMQPFLVGRHGSGFIGMMVGLVPLLTVLVSVPLLRQWPSLRQAIGVFGGLACLALIMRDGLDRSVPLPHLFLAISVPLGYAISNTLIKRHLSGVPSLSLTLWCLGSSVLVLGPLALSREELRAGGETLLVGTLCVAVLGVVGTGLAIFGLYRLIQLRGPLYAGMVTYLIPLGAVLWGWLDGEEVTTLQLAAMAGVIAMVVLVQWPERRRPGAAIGQTVEAELGS